jgi:hypothetical protein
VEKAEWCFAHPIESERIAANANELAASLSFETEVLNAIFRALAARDVTVIG